MPNGSSLTYLHMKRAFGAAEDYSQMFATKHPVLLPWNHHLTVLVVREAHERVRHNETLTETKRRFWIPKRRSLVRCLIHHCALCRMYEGAPFKGPRTFCRMYEGAPFKGPPLPVFHVKEDPAFSYTRVDFAGPLTIRTNHTTDSQVWICLFK